MDINTIKRDPGKIEAGAWVYDVPGLEDIHFKVRGLTSPIVVATDGRLRRKVPRNQRNSDGTLKTDVAMRIQCEVLAEAVLLDWENVEIGGKPVPYSPELAKQILLNPEFMLFADGVFAAAQIVDRGLHEQQEDLTKNSRKPSRGESATGTEPAT